MKDRKPNPKSPRGRVSFPKVFEKSDYSGKYELTLVFPPGSDLSEMKVLAKEAAKKKWGKKIPSNLRNPFRSVSDKPEWYGEDFDPDSVFVAFRSAKRKPQVVDAAREAIMDESEFYAGCWARCTYNAYTYDRKPDGTKVTPGVAFGLINIQKLEDDDPLSAMGVSAEDDFGKADSDDPSNYDSSDDDIFGGETVDDDIPF